MYSSSRRALIGERRTRPTTTTCEKASAVAGRALVLRTPRPCACAPSEQRARGPAERHRASCARVFPRRPVGPGTGAPAGPVGVGSGQLCVSRCARYGLDATTDAVRAAAATGVWRSRQNPPPMCAARPPGRDVHRKRCAEAERGRRAGRSRTSRPGTAARARDNACGWGEGVGGTCPLHFPRCPNTIGQLAARRRAQDRPPRRASACPADVVAVVELTAAVLYALTASGLPAQRPLAPAAVVTVAAVVAARVVVVVAAPANASAAQRRMARRRAAAGSSNARAQRRDPATPACARARERARFAGDRAARARRPALHGRRAPRAVHPRRRARGVARAGSAATAVAVPTRRRDAAAYSPARS